MINLKYQFQHRMKSLNYLVDHVLYKITDSPSITIYISKIANRITFKIKTRYYLELLTPQTMKLLQRTKSKTSKNENGANVPLRARCKSLIYICS